MFELRIALYLATQIESDKVKEVFYINKQLFNKNVLFKTINISKKGKILMNLIFKEIIEQNVKDQTIFYNKEYNLSELKKICNKSDYNIDLPALSRLVSKLIKKGHFKKRREGRLKYVSLTETGLIFCPVNDIIYDIEKNINLNY